MLSGARLGRYLLTQKLGAGGMAEIWEAFDESLHRNVAVKVILPAISRETEFRERFLREARLAASLEHPHIVPIYDFGYEGEQAFLVTPILRGGSIRDRFANPLAPGQALRWLTEIASALDHAHAQGVLHRDVTPANILFDRNGRLFLCDFGLAKHAHGPSELTAAGVVVGTPSYMSPEQASGRVTGPRSDQYALGVIAYRLLTGRLPFTAEAPIAVLHKTLTEPPPPATSFNPALRPEVDTVFDTVLAKTPEQRYPSCGAFVEALSRAVAVTMATAVDAAVPASGTLPMADAPTSRPAAETATIVTPPTAGPAVERTGPTAAGAPPLPVSRVTPPPLPATTRSGPRLGAIAALVAIAAAGVVVFVMRSRKPESSPTPSAPSLPALTPPPSPALPPSPAMPTPEAMALPTEPPIVIVSKEPTAVPTRRPRATPTQVVLAESAPDTAPDTRAERAPRPEPAPKRETSVEPATRADTTVTVKRGVKINVDPTDARVFLDGRYIGISNDWDGHGGGELLTFDDEGTHHLRFAYPGYRDRHVDVKVSRSADKEMREVEDKLEKGSPGGSTGPEGKLSRPSYQTRGTVRFKVEPADANVTVDGKDYGSASRYAEEDLTLRSPGVHDVVLRAPGHREKTFRVIAAPAADKEHVVIKEKLKKD